MSLWWITGIIVAFVLGLLIGGYEETVITDCDRCRGQNWHIWVESTSDPSRYRGKYTSDESTRYEVEANGVLNTLRELADEIEEP